MCSENHIFVHAVIILIVFTSIYTCILKNDSNIYVQNKCRYWQSDTILFDAELWSHMMNRNKYHVTLL